MSEARKLWTGIYECGDVIGYCDYGMLTLALNLRIVPDEFPMEYVVWDGTDILFIDSGSICNLAELADEDDHPAKDNLLALLDDANVTIEALGTCKLNEEDVTALIALAREEDEEEEGFEVIYPSDTIGQPQANQ